MYLSVILVNVGDNPDRPRPGRLWIRDAYRIHQRLCMAFPSDNRLTSDPLFLKPYRSEDFGWSPEEGRHAPPSAYSNSPTDEEPRTATPVHVHARRRPDSGFLFRLDPLPDNRAVILVQSAIRPSWSYAFQNAPHLILAAPQVHEWNPTFAVGQTMRFRLLANATRKISREDRPEGKNNRSRRVPVLRENLPEWLKRQADKYGFAFDDHLLQLRTSYVYCGLPTDHSGPMPEDTDDAEAPPVGKHGGRKKGGRVRLFAAHFDGILHVTDPDLFRTAIVEGIGPAKGFGFGLLSVANV